MALTHVGFDDHGNTFKMYTKFPRKELLEYLGYKKASKMYRDPNAEHVGWIIGSHWISVYRVDKLKP